ncbi:aminotransferase DegT (plasmid) [Halorientalis sp. IM1011]|uniref:DegT/DnrJ/EryC1/StrS family aminotransferase n=1 Tax=Halorientalis sp. IM1011 TaxID=1932360 RepID=UPI00097CC702|nr:DegT/DnrJ/EryC1/StrS family aminotransferase [Halorientalis sp. IM1011]AQL44811.1 aminotransferase DegT [Halorientalis sp. IM1011]
MVDVSIADPELGPEERERVLSVLDSGQLADGDVVRAFESEFADYCGTDHAVATTNGTTALQTALEAAGVEPGRAVVTTPFSFVATGNAVRFAGGIPLFADIDPETYNLDPHSVEERIRATDEEVAAILAVHLYGCPADMDHLRDIADTYDVALVADAAQAHGAEIDGQRVGSLADVSSFSFYPTKNMTTGEGGMITTDREDIADAAERFIDHGRGTDTYEHVELGHNFRMTNLEAAIGRVQLQRLPEFNRQRRENARLLTERLAGSDVETPTEPDGRRHVYHQYTVRCDDREGLASALESRGIGTGIYYPTPIHQLDAYDGFAANAPRAEQASNEVLSLPVHPNVDEDDIDEIATELTALHTTV